STVSQKAALAAWTDEAEAARAETRRIFRARRDELMTLITNELKLRAVAPEGAFYLMLDVSAHGRSLEVAELLLAHRVITVPGAAFGAEGEGYLRLSFCADAATLAEGVRRIKTALEQR
ncbi:MAG TPA: aminotransferase class I/II-fold pyridoxal phosphate-dependent enzyme, partial [Pyrinomonadaceae bacterium]|nr:aminotransferase class I/II-fold pyridoxal phosphate-dependent enzyme [Pyrinomonadaceae bacterium]